MRLSANEHRDLAQGFADNLRRLRRQTGFSQEELGFMASLHRTEISHLERAMRVPRLDTILKLAGALSVPAGELLKGMDWSTPVAPPLGSFQIADAQEEGD